MVLDSRPQDLCAHQIGGFAGLVGKASAQLTVRSQALANKEAGRCSSLPKKPSQAHPREGFKLAEERYSSVTADTVSRLCEQGQLTEAVEALEILVQKEYPISKPLLYTLLKACVVRKDLVLGRRVHALTVKTGYDSDTFLSNHIMRMYASQARLQEAMDVFTVVTEPDAFMWSSIISAHVRQGQAKQAIKLYHDMRRSNVKPDGHVFVAALQACARGADLETGQQVHTDVLASGVEPDSFVCSCLVDMYAKCGSLEDAQRVFAGLPHKTVVTWNAMMTGYSQQGMGREALCLFSEMQKEGLTAPDAVTFVCLLQACASVGIPALERGKQLHRQIEEQGLQVDGVVGCSLVNMYAKCGSLEDAQRVFAGLRQKDVVTWNAMITGCSQKGMGRQALSLYNAMQKEGMAAPNHVTFVGLLQACASLGTPALDKGKHLHAEIEKQGLQSRVIVANSLINMYAKCGSLEDAHSIFHGLGQKDVVTWNAMIAGYSQQGMVQEAFHLFSAMQEEGCAAPPDSVTFASLLHTCASLGNSALEKGKRLHVQIEEEGLLADVFVANCLVDMYAKCGSLEDAQRVFDGLGQKDVVTWNAILSGYSQQNMGQEALNLYSAMIAEGGPAPDSVTFVCLLQACASVGTPALDMGKQLDAQIGKQGLQADVLVANGLINMYAKCGSLVDARTVFNRVGNKDVMLWNSMIAGYLQAGRGLDALHLYSAMQQEGMASPNSATFVCLLQACASVGTPALEKGQQLHLQIGERGLQVDRVVGSSLVNMYAKCGSLSDAKTVFDKLVDKDVVTWSALIAGYSQQGMGQEALHIYSAMQDEGISAPDSVTFVCLLQACASVGNAALEQGKQLHAQIGEQGLQVDLFVANSLINMYAKCGSVEDAQRVFYEVGQKDVITWNAMIAGYAQQGMGQEALHLYSGMEEEGLAAPDSVTFVSLLQACASVGTLALEKGRKLHAQIGKQGLQADVVVGCSLVNMYAKCGSLHDAQSVFDSLIQKNVATWTALITGYMQQGMGQEALRLYSAMQDEGIAPEHSVAFVCLLQACAGVAALDAGRQLHAQIEEQGLQADSTVGNSLINMYAKSGSMVDAQQVFDALPDRDIVAWNALIAGYTRQGDSESVFSLVHRMKECGIQPDSITFLSLLTVCSHAGLVSKGQEYFEAMSRQYGISPAVEHYTCMVDLLGRAGDLDIALAVVLSMPVQPHIAVWHTLLSACRKWTNVAIGRHAFNEAVKLDAKDAAAYVLMSMIYSGAQMWEEAQEMQVRRQGMGARKQPGQSWWTDIDGLVHSFVVGDRKHLQIGGEYASLNQLVL